MKRALVLLLSTIAVLGLGCGYNSYEKRATDTETSIKNQIRLDHYLSPAPTGKFQEFGFFLRPPKALQGAPKFALLDLPPGMYDVDGSFLAGKDAGAVNLHVLARRKLAKKAPAKKPTPADAAPRGPFPQDVLGVLGQAYGSEVPAELRSTSIPKDKNTYKRQTFPLSNNPNTANVQVYYYTEKASNGDTYDAALIWERPTTVPSPMEEAIDLTLKSFAVGPKAARAFSGEAVDEGAAGEAGGPATAF